MMMMFCGAILFIGRIARQTFLVMVITMNALVH